MRRKILSFIWQALVAPRGTPAAVVKALDQTLRKTEAESSFVALVARNENTIDYKGTEVFSAEIRRSFEDNRQQQSCGRH